MHVDLAGRPLYRRRFAAVEAFCSGQARVERFDGGLEVIDEARVRVVDLRPALRSELAALSGDLAGFWRTQAICTAVELGVFEALPRALRLGSGWRAPDISAEVAADPARVTPHHRMLTSYALHDYPAVPVALDLRGNERVIDAGGGVGALADLLVEVYPSLQVTVLDRPEVVERAARGQKDDGVTFRAADLFGPWSVDGDAVILARVLHDWDDAPALRILRRAHRALPSGGRLFVVEMVLPEGGSAGGLCDLHLLAVTGGRERTASEYAALLDRAGFAFHGVRHLPALPSVVVGRAR